MSLITLSVPTLYTYTYIHTIYIYIIIGFFPIWARFAPASTCQLVVFEALLSAAGYDAL